MKPKRLMVPNEPPSRVYTLMLVLLAVWVLAAGLAQAADTAPPTITVGPYGSYPLTYLPVQDGTTITDGMLRFRADVYDASNIFSAPILTLDGNPLRAQIGHPEAGDDGEGDWDFTWWWVMYSGPIENGFHTLVLTATDSLGNTATQTFGLNVGTLTTITEFKPVTYGGNLRPILSAKVNTGLNPGSIKLTLDGAPVAHTYDAMTGLVTYVPPADLADESYHTVLLSVADKSQAWKFYTTTYPDMADSNVGNCTSCHISYTSAEWAWGAMFAPLTWEAVHANRVRFGGVWHEVGGSDCWVCHKEGGYSGIEVKSSGFSVCGQCHGWPGDGLGYGSGWYHGQHEGIKYAPFKRDPAIPIRVAENREKVDCIVCHQPGVTMLRTSLTEVASHDIPEAHKTAQPECNGCHARSLTREHARRTTNDGQPITCGTCHLSSDVMVVSAIATGNKNCFGCHDNLADDHQNFEHSAAPNSGPVVIFADTDHDDAGWVGDKPYFDILVNCSTCHNNQLPAIHGNDCSTCHPTPYDTLQTWGGGCQQGGCHSSYHQDSTTAHLPFEDPSDPQNDCSRCHDPNWAVPQSNCLNCHAAYTPGDVTPPVTTSNTHAEYYGPARIDFSITDNGKVGIGGTFYRLDGGPVTAGSQVLVSDPGSHELEFWSKDQYGNTELVPNNVFFSIGEDNTPPVTTSNAQATYSQGAVITLTATDDSPQGVKTTYFRLDDGPIQTGTSVVIPATSGTVAYTLTFWSEDWAGNIEAEKSVNFTVTSGTGTIRLVWGDSDVSGSPCSGDPGADATWTIGRVGSGTVVASGSGGCPNWSGVNDVAVPVSATPYFVLIDWWNSYDEYYDQTVFSSVYVTTPGQVVRLSY